MKKSSKVKYFGVAAAALLAVAPVVAPAVTATTNEPATVQAATGTPAKVASAQVLKTNSVNTYLNGKLASATYTGAGINFTNTSATTTINDTLYFTAIAPISYAQDGVTYTPTQAIYVPVAAYLTLAYAVNQYFTGDASSVTTDGVTAADPITTDAVKKLFTDGKAYVTAVYTDVSGAQFYSIAYDGTTYFVPTAGLNLSTTVKVSNVTGMITTNMDDVPTFTDSAISTATGSLIRDKGTDLLVDQVSKTADGTVLAYHVVSDSDIAAGAWVPATAVTYTDGVLTSFSATGKVVANDEIATYSDKATTTKTGNTIADGETVNYTRVVKNSVTGKVVAYGFKNEDGVYEYVKAASVTVDTTADVTTAKVANGTALYSNYKAATIYTNAAATEDSGTKLSTDVNEWSAFEVSKDADGNTIAYRLGKNQWVKAADLEAEQALDGTFDVAAGITLSDAEGTKTGSIENGGNYKVFAVRYINGKQALKLGTDNQWVIAAQGDYYPA